MFEPLEKAGILTFTFTINPILFKQMQAKLAQATQEGQPPNPAAAQQQAKKPNEILEVEFINKSTLNQVGFERFVTMIGQCYKDEDEQNQEELVRGLSRDYMIWAK